MCKDVCRRYNAAMMKALIILPAILLCACGGLQTVAWPASEPVTVHAQPPENAKLPRPRQDSFGNAEFGFRIEYQTGGLMTTVGHIVQNTQSRHSPWVEEPLDLDLLVHLELAPGTPLPQVSVERLYEPRGRESEADSRMDHVFDLRGPDPTEYTRRSALAERANSGPSVTVYREVSHARATAFEDGTRRLTIRYRWRLDPEAKDWKVHQSKLRFDFADGYEVAWPLFQ